MKPSWKPSPTESPLLFEVDDEPLEETLTAWGGVPLVVQAFRSLGVPARVRQHVHIKQRERGYDEATMVERFVVLADEFRDGNVPARMSPLTVAKRAFVALHAAILRVPETGWSLYGKADGREIRECAEVDFVPGEKG